MAIENKNFIGGLNSDDEDRLLPNGDYRFALNIRASMSDNSNQGSIENTKGNSVVNIKLPEGTNRVIGSLDDITSNRVFYFLFNDRGNHSIYEFDVSNNSITLLLQTPVLNFKSTKYINDPQIIDDLLFFNDRINPPRMVNVDRLKNNGYPLPLDESSINVIVDAPGHPPTATYSSDPNVRTNNVRNKLFQFRYKYIYLDNQESAWSSISKTPLPIDESSFRPLAYYPTELNNIINIDIELGSSYVKKIKIAAREQNTGDFFLVTEIDKDKLNIPSQQIIYTYKFYNDEVYTAIDNDGNTGMRLFDNVPQKADSLALIDGNKLSFGGITEGYDPVDIDIDIKKNLTTSENIQPPSVYTYNNPDYFNGYGFVGVRIVDRNDNLGRVINGKNYLLLGVERQEYRDGTQSSVLFPPGGQGTLLVPPFATQGVGYYGAAFFNYFTAGSIRDRAIKIENTTTGKQIEAGGSIFNEILIEDPQVAGTRFVLTVNISYIDIGTTDSQKNKYIKVQYTSVQGDTAEDVCNGLRNELINIGTLTEGVVDIKVDQSRTLASGWIHGAGAPVPPNKSLLRVWGEAYVPASRKTDPTPFSWLTVASPDTGCMYWMQSKLDVYADWTLRSNKSLKSGATHAIGMVYMDESNRSGLTNISNQKTFYVPFFSERSIQSGSLPNNTTLTLTVNHTPPEWASRYQIVYSGNQTIEYLPGSEGYKGFIQFKLKNVASASGTPGAKQATIGNIIDYNNFVPEDIDLGYSFSKGDRIRFITEPISGNTINYLQSYKDVEMISYDNTTNTITFKDPGITVSDNMLVEIYTPKKKSDNPVYYEVGECYDIVNGYHYGSSQNQNANQPAIIELDDIGDVYLRYRVNPIGSIIESYSFSDYYISDSWDKGRPNIVDNNIGQTYRKSTIRFSDNYIPNTNINGLSTFNDFSFQEYDQQYGSIERMYAQDKDLIVFQNLKVGKVRIGQTTLYGNEGTSIATLKSQDKVLSDMVYYSGEYGIGKNPESFSVYGNRLYFVDVSRGAVLRLGGDGITPISKYKMHNYFNDIFKRLIDNNKNYKVFGVYDVRFDEYIISIQDDISDIELKTQPVITPQIPVLGKIEETTKDIQTTSSVEQNSLISNFESLNIDSTTKITDTLAFSEYKTRWVTYYSFVPDYMSSNNIDLITFKDGLLYRHNKNNTYNNFYNIQHDMLIELISNAEPNLIKFYNNIFTESTHVFSMPEAKNQFGQKTSLLESDFFDDEGVYKAAFLMDENTPNVSNPLIEGDNIRCHSLSVLLKNSDTELVKIFNVGIGLNPSLLTGK